MGYLSSMAETRVAHREALIDRSSIEALNREIAAARWARHRLLDLEVGKSRRRKTLGFEGRLQKVAEGIAPGITRVGRIVSTLCRRAKRRSRTPAGKWSPDPRPDLLTAMRDRLDLLRKKRNADPRWKAACRWSDEAGPGAPLVLRRRQAGESDEAFAIRCGAGKRRGRREHARVKLYSRAHCHADTWNALVVDVDRSRRAVIAERTKGLPADMHRPKWNDNVTIVSDKAWHSRVQENGDWWTIEIPVGSTARGGIEGTVRFRARLGNAGIGAAELRRLQLTRRKDMTGWRYYVSVTIITQERKYPGTGVVGLDWGHREHGHALASAGIRAFTWWGDDGRCGEILIPREARECLDRCSTEQSRIDVAWDARKKTLELDGIRSRHGYRKRVMRNGVRSKDERLWLMWETRIERRRQAARKRAAALRREAYIAAVKELRQWYATFVIEDQPGKEARDLDTEEMTRHRKRQNRELVARYEFVSRCERSGAAVIRVSARNTTRECPTCGVLAEKTQDLLIACPGCGIVRDRDYGAAKVILRRGEQVLAVSSASAQDHSGAAQ